MDGQQIRRDPSLDYALAQVRRRHRQSQQSGFTLAQQAKRESQRAHAVTEAELLIMDYAQEISSSLHERPDLSTWIEQVERLCARWPTDPYLQQDLTCIRHTLVEPLRASEIELAVTNASVAFMSVLKATKANPSGPSHDGSQARRLPRRVKKHLRREAQADLEAVLAGLSMAALHVRNPGLEEVKVVASGSLLRTATVI